MGGHGKRSAERLTHRRCLAAQHSGTTYTMKDGREVAAREVLWDVEPRGLGLRLHPSGRKTWVLRFRHRGSTKLHAIADFPAVLLDVAPDPHRQEAPIGARQRARRALAALAAGEDPFPAPVAAPTFADIADELLEDLSSRGIKASTRAKYRENYLIVAQTLGGILVSDLDERTARRAFRAWRERGPVAANAALRMLREALRFAQRAGYRDRRADDPTRDLRKLPERKRGLRLSADELSRLGAALDELAEVKPNLADGVLALRLLALTGARRREITGLAWGEVDLPGRRIRLPASRSKTGEREIALSTAAMALFAALPQGEATERVFPCDRHEVGWSVQYVWRLARAAARLPPDARIHDLRHSFVTWGLSANYSEALVGKAVGHSSAATTRRYSHLNLDPVREVSERIGGEIAAALRGAPAADVVTPEKWAG